MSVAIRNFSQLLILKPNHIPSKLIAAKTLSVFALSGGSRVTCAHKSKGYLDLTH